jgi:hypothetical protein
MLPPCHLLCRRDRNTVVTQIATIEGYLHLIHVKLSLTG